VRHLAALSRPVSRRLVRHVRPLLRLRHVGEAVARSGLTGGRRRLPDRVLGAAVGSRTPGIEVETLPLLPVGSGGLVQRLAASASGGRAKKMADISAFQILGVDVMITNFCQFFGEKIGVFSKKDQCYDGFLLQKN
jgi:hypothetical protein